MESLWKCVLAALAPLATHVFAFLGGMLLTAFVALKKELPTLKADVLNLEAEIKKLWDKL